ncbi:hypothetical protein HYH02_010587 [Chlamydomonas schloesseri]|uniref:Uncharacterized protein n=1 Tax=Chlamydomonas schloesseri TaxID=2026947 RepID=A0A835W711_9CHLO|nr:hypothetical protein HYH02_010587 [Chlamydomonas schloesseri]|eukprot:KAG2439708.1 hypothetical protein HYH02_010587 [Chlamydomonas schloesseri]
MANAGTALEERSSSTFELPPSKRQRFVMCYAQPASGWSESEALEDRHGRDSCPHDTPAPPPGASSPTQPALIACKAWRFDATAVSSSYATVGALSPSPAARESSCSSFSSSAPAGALQDAQREQLHEGAAAIATSSSSSASSSQDPQAASSSQDPQAAAASFTLPSAPAPPSAWRHVQQQSCRPPPLAVAASPLAAARPCLEGPEEWMVRVQPTLGLSSPDTLRLALHTWRRVQQPVTMLVQLRTTRAVPAACAASSHHHHHLYHHPSSASAAARLLPLPLPLPVSKTSTSASYGGGSPGGCGDGSSPAPYAPAAAAAAVPTAQSADVLAISKRLRTERAFAAACVRLAAKLQERRQVTRTLTEPLAAASGTNSRIILNAEVCVMRWVEWDLLAGFVPEDSHLICGAGWET